MRLGLSLGPNSRNTSPASRVAGFLSATKGGMWRPGTLSTAFESADNSDPAEIGDGVQYMVEALRGTVTPLPWSQSTAGARPTLQAGYLALDGGDALDGGANVLDIFRNVGAACLAGRFRVDVLASDRVLCSWGTGTTGIRFQVNLLTTGALQVQLRRADADAGTQNFSTATGLITVGADFSFLLTVDYATGGAGAVRLYIDNGADAINGTLTGTGSTSNTASAAARWGQNSAGAASVTGRAYPLLAANAIPTAQQRADIFAVMLAG